MKLKFSSSNHKVTIFLLFFFSYLGSSLSIQWVTKSVTFETWNHQTFDQSDLLIKTQNENQLWPKREFDSGISGQFNTIARSSECDIQLQLHWKIVFIHCSNSCLHSLIISFVDHVNSLTFSNCLHLNVFHLIDQPDDCRYFSLQS